MASKVINGGRYDFGTIYTDSNVVDFNKSIGVGIGDVPPFLFRLRRRERKMGTATRQRHGASLHERL